MKTKLPILLVLLMTIVFGCSNVDPQFKKVLATPAEYNGKEIQIIGYFHEQPGDTAMYLTKEGNKKEAFHMRNILLKSFEGFAGHEVTVKGLFDENDKGPSGNFAGTLNNAHVVMEESTLPLDEN
jgi:hypothetical protein